MERKTQQGDGKPEMEVTQQSLFKVLRQAQVEHSELSPSRTRIFRGFHSMEVSRILSRRRKGAKRPGVRLSPGALAWCAPIVKENGFAPMQVLQIAYSE
jgi:hypothetical protein